MTYTLFTDNAYSDVGKGSVDDRLIGALYGGSECEFEKYFSGYEFGYTDEDNDDIEDVATVDVDKSGNSDWEKYQ